MTYTCREMGAVTRRGHTSCSAVTSRLPCLVWVSHLPRHSATTRHTTTGHRYPLIVCSGQSSGISALCTKCMQASREVHAADPNFNCFTINCGGTVSHAGYTTPVVHEMKNLGSHGVETFQGLNTPQISAGSLDMAPPKFKVVCPHELGTQRTSVFSLFLPGPELSCSSLLYVVPTAQNFLLYANHDQLTAGREPLAVLASTATLFATASVAHRAESHGSCHNQQEDEPAALHERTWLVTYGKMPMKLYLNQNQGEMHESSWKTKESSFLWLTDCSHRLILRWNAEDGYVYKMEAPAVSTELCMEPDNSVGQTSCICQSLHICYLEGSCSQNNRHYRTWWPGSMGLWLLWSVPKSHSHPPCRFCVLGPFILFSIVISTFCSNLVILQWCQVVNQQKSMLQKSETNRSVLKAAQTLEDSCQLAYYSKPQTSCLQLSTI